MHTKNLLDIAQVAYEGLIHYVRPWWNAAIAQTLPERDAWSYDSLCRNAHWMRQPLTTTNAVTCVTCVSEMLRWPNRFNIVARWQIDETR